MPHSNNILLSVFSEMSSRWNEFIVEPREFRDGTPIRTCDWVLTILKDAILPEIKRQGYTLSVSQNVLVNCILNAFYCHQKNYYASNYTVCNCKCATSQEYTLEQYEYFHSRRIGDSFWSYVRRTYEVSFLSDDGPFADRVWNEIPSIIFSHLSMSNSHANKDLEELNKIIEDEEEYWNNE